VPGLLGALEERLAAALLDDGPLTGPELRRLLALRDPPRVKRALERLQRELVITRAGEAAQAQGWDAAIFDLIARRFGGRLGRLPARDEALERLAAAVLGCAGVLSAADLAKVLGCSRPEAAEALDRLARTGRAERRGDRPVRWTRPGQGVR
jgi:Mn-dependent DtxR family transcriptional regulator